MKLQNSGFQAAYAKQNTVLVPESVVLGHKLPEYRYHFSISGCMAFSKPPSTSATWRFSPSPWGSCAEP